MSSPLATRTGIPLLRFRVGESRRLRVVAEGAFFREHWMGTHNMLCGGPHCPACELWSPKAQLLLVCEPSRSHGGPSLVAVVVPATASARAPAIGEVIEVSRRSRETRVVTIRVDEGIRARGTLAWSVLAEVYRLPSHPECAGVAHDRWLTSVTKIAEARLRQCVIR